MVQNTGLTLFNQNQIHGEERTTIRGNIVPIVPEIFGGQNFCDILCNFTDFMSPQMEKPIDAGVIMIFQLPHIYIFNFKPQKLHSKTFGGFV